VQTAPSATGAVFTYGYDATNRRVSQKATHGQQLLAVSGRDGLDGVLHREQP
jgi:hypothetical protein